MMDCPRCDATLSPLRGRSNLVIDYCPACGGVWYDAGEFSAFYDVLGPLEILTEGADRRPGVTCPRCSIQMAEVTYPPPDGVRVDTCPSCEGLWLDKGEVSELRDKVRAIQRAANQLVMTEAGDHVEIPHRKGEVQRAKISPPWVVAGFLVIVLTQVGVSGFLQAVAALDQLADKEPRLSAGAIGAISALTAFPLSGFLVGRFSPGFTILEPAIAAVPAAILLFVWLREPVGPLILGLILPLGLAMAGLGAVAGERRHQ